MKAGEGWGLVAYPVFAGYGHRVSMSTADHGVQKFGGCWLPPSPHGRPMGHEEKENYIFQYSPPGIQHWVRRCKEELGRTPRRGVVVHSELYLELPAPRAYPEIGLYTESHSARVPSQETAARYVLVMSLPPPSFVETDFRQPPEPTVVPHIGKTSGNSGKCMWLGRTDLRAPPSSVGFVGKHFLLLSPIEISMKQWQQHHEHKQQQKREQKRNGWPHAKLERTGARRHRSSRFVDNDSIADKRSGGGKA